MNIPRLFSVDQIGDQLPQMRQMSHDDQFAARPANQPRNSPNRIVRTHLGLLNQSLLRRELLQYARCLHRPHSIAVPDGHSLDSHPLEELRYRASLADAALGERPQTVRSSFACLAVADQE